MPKRKYNLGKFEFLAQKDEILKLQNAGLPLSYIWKKLKDEGKINISYSQFTRYVNPKSSPEKIAPQKKAPQKTENTEIKNFQFQANSINKDDLI